MARKRRDSDERLAERVEQDQRLSGLFEQMAKFVDAEEVLFRNVIDAKDLNLAHVERLLVVARRLELFVRCRDAWRGN